MAQTIEELSFRLNIDPAPVLTALGNILTAFNAIRTSVDATTTAVNNLIAAINRIPNQLPNLNPGNNGGGGGNGGPGGGGNGGPGGGGGSNDPGNGGGNGGGGGDPGNGGGNGGGDPGNGGGDPGNGGGDPGNGGGGGDPGNGGGGGGGDPDPDNGGGRPIRPDGETRRWVTKIKRLVMPLIALFSARAVWKGYMEGVKQIERYTDSVKMNAAELSSWAKANEAAGGSQKAFLDAMQKWTEKTGKTGDDFINMMLDLNTKTKEQQKEFLKLNQISEDAAAIFRQNDAEIVSTLQVMKELAYTEKDIENVKEFNKQWNTFKILAQGIGEMLIRLVVPAFEIVLKFLNQIQRLMIEHKRLMIALGTLAAVAIGNIFVHQMLAAAGAGGLLVKVFKALTAGIGLFSKALWASPITWLLVALGLIILAVEDLMVFARGGKSLFGELLEDWGISKDKIAEIRKEFQEVGKGFSQVWDLIKQGFAYLMGYSTEAEVGIKEFLIAPLKLLVLAVAGVIKVLKVLAHVYAWLGANIAHQAEMLPEYMERAGTWIMEIWDGINNFIRDLWTGLTTWFSEKCEEIKNFFVSAWDSVNNVIIATGQLIQQYVIDPIMTAVNKILELKNGAGNYLGEIAQGASDLWGTFFGDDDEATKPLPGGKNLPNQTNNTTNNNDVTTTVNIYNPQDSGKSAADVVNRQLLQNIVNGQYSKG